MDRIVFARALVPAGAFDNCGIGSWAVGPSSAVRNCVVRRPLVLPDRSFVGTLGNRPFDSSASVGYGIRDITLRRVKSSIGGGVVRQE
jgi:hypothetical protein